MRGLALQIDSLLRCQSPTAAVDGREKPWPLTMPIAFVCLFGILYGAIMGTFAGPEGVRGLQMLYSGLKVPLLLLVTFAVSLPSFFVLNTLLGVRDDFAQAVRALAATQAGLTIILSSLAPFTVVWYASSTGYQAAILFNAFMFGIASISAQLVLRRLYRPLIQRNRKHLLLLRAWLVMYAFVGIQMGWVLRPFIGNPGSATTFFREGAWGNAYVEVIRIAMGAMGWR